MYLSSQIESLARELAAHAYGNPHSINPSAMRSDFAVEDARDNMLRLFGTSSETHTLVLTRSGTGALKLVGDAFPWSEGSVFAHLRSNHNSVLGMRQQAQRHGARVGALDPEDVDAWLASSDIEPELRRSDQAEHFDDGSLGFPSEQGIGDRDAPATLWQRFQARLVSLVPVWITRLLPSPASSHASSLLAPLKRRGSKTYSLLAYPAKDNYAGVLYPLGWAEAARSKADRQHEWLTVLDTAAFAPVHALNLTETRADFAVFSFYKLFGFPTGVGALIVRNERLGLLRKTYWGGGSVFLATAQLDWHQLKDFPMRFEDGTLPFLDIVALQFGLRVFKDLGGTPAVERHAHAVSRYAYERLAALRHSNGAPMVRVFGAHARVEADGYERGGKKAAGMGTLPRGMDRRPLGQGSTINLLLLDPQGEVRSYRSAGLRMAQAGLHVRVGCTCNPGECYRAVGVTDAEVRDYARSKAGNYTVWEWIRVERRLEPHQEEAVEALDAANAQWGGFAFVDPSFSVGSSRSLREKHRESSSPAKKKRTVTRKLPLGSIRISFGHMSRFEDALAIVHFVESRYRDEPASEDPPEGSAPANAEMAQGALAFTVAH